MNLKSLVTTLTFLSFVPFSAAMAGTDNSSLTVQVTVESGCSLVGGTMDFGTYTSGQSSALEAEGTISYADCPVGNLSLELASGQSSDVDNRFMTDGGDAEQLNYQLYRSAGRTAVWGEGSNAQTVQLLARGGGTVTVYGSVPGNQAVSAGSFSDTIAMTLTF